LSWPPRSKRQWKNVFCDSCGVMNVHRSIDDVDAMGLPAKSMPSLEHTKFGRGIALLLKAL